MTEGSFAPRETYPEESKWWYLAIVDDGTSQIGLANTLLDAFDRALFKPEVSYSGLAMREIAPKASPTNLLEAMWLLARDHPGRYVMTCENCHRTVLSGTQGGERRFCSDSCRATWNKAHRTGR